MTKTSYFVLIMVMIGISGCWEKEKRLDHYGEPSGPSTDDANTDNLVQCRKVLRQCQQDGGGDSYCAAKEKDCRKAKGVE